jgi:hypothetical protein
LPLSPGSSQISGPGHPIAKLPQLFEHGFADGSSFSSQKDLGSLRMIWMRLYDNEAKTATTISGLTADISEIARHLASVYAHPTRVRIDAFAFIKSDHQERGHKRKRYRARAAQIRKRLKRV